MCDQTEVSYLPEDVVWVKLGPVWWPGRVCRESEIPPEIMKDLRKTPIAIVKFFQEDSFEYVKKLTNIYHYNCLRKNEFIKKGLDMLRSKNRDAPSNMKLFPEDIVTAEYLTNGNPAILQDEIFIPEEKPTYADLFATNKKTPKKVKAEGKKKSQLVKQSTPRLITHPRFLQLSSGHATDYEARERKQEPLRAECDEEDTSPPTTYRCTDCEYTTTRLNVMVWHNKSHTRNYASPVAPAKATKRKSTVSVKFKERLSTSVEYKSDDVEELSAKIPKTNGTLKVRSPKTPGRKKSASPKKVVAKISPDTKETKQTSPMKTSPPIRKPKRLSAPKSDEFQNSLLEDWPEDEMDHDIVKKETDESTSLDSQDDKSHVTPNVSTNSVSTKAKSCFDFDDSDDHLVIDKSKFKLGRKIPRLLDDVKLGKDSVAPDDETSPKSEPMALDDATAEETKYRSGVDDAVAAEECVDESRSQTSQLQEMGVDNEIEINTEEPSGEDITETAPIDGRNEEACVESDSPQAIKKERDAAELGDKVEKLLAEISSPVPKLPEIPRPHKKVHLKAYRDSLAKQREAAEKRVSPAAEPCLPETHDIEVSSIPLPSSPPPANRVPPVEYVARDEAAPLTSTQPAEADTRSGAVATARPVETDTSYRTTAPVQAADTDTSTEAQTLARLVDADTSMGAQTLAGLARAGDAHTSSETTGSSRRAETDTSGAPPSVGGIVTETSKDETLVVENATPVVESAPSVEIADEPPLVAETMSEETVVADCVTSASAAATHAAGESDASAVTSSQPADVAACPPAMAAAAATTASVPRAALKFSTTPKLKQINAGQLKQLNSGQLLPLKIIPSFINKISPSSPNKTCASGGGGGGGGGADQQLKMIKMKTPDGRSIVCNLTSTSQKMLLANSQSPGSPTKYIILRKPPATAAAPTAASPAVAANSAAAAGVGHATAFRLQPNILQKTPQKTAAVTAAATSTKSVKNIVLDANTLHSLLQSQQQHKSTTAPVLPDVVAESSAAVLGHQSSQILYVAGDNNVAATASAAVGQTVNYEYIVDEAGNLVNVTSPAAAAAAGCGATTLVAARDKDILAKALENTDGLQTEMALSSAAANSVLDACSVAQNTQLTYKTEAVVYENLALSTTAPIMSAYETPSRATAAAAAAPMADVAADMTIVQGDDGAHLERVEYNT